jgi:methylase of polypeptide subunit release factors
VTVSNAPDDALLELLRLLSVRHYRFVTPTPLTHARVITRANRPAASKLTDVFGWSLPFSAELLGDELMRIMRDANVVQPEGQLFRSLVRVSSLDGTLFLHSAYPTLAADSVFFGPDTYRYLRFVLANLSSLPHRSDMRCLDIGCGSGAGAIVTARHLHHPHWLLTDINPEAMRLSVINARFADIEIETRLGDVMADSEGSFDLVICNPPYLADPEQRSYRHGGGALGRDLSLRIATEASARLKPGGRLLLYTGVAIVDGEDPLHAEIRGLFDTRDFRWEYEEIDPDVFGEELEQPAYLAADRIAAVGLVVTRHA